MCMGMLPNGEGKGFRVALDTNLAHRKGIFATNLEQLKQKVIQRFKLKLCPEKINLFLDDGTEIEDDDYFAEIKSQSLLVVEINGKIRGQNRLTPENVFDQFLSLVRWSGGTSQVYQEVVEFLKEDFSSKYATISQHVDKSTLDNCKYSTREEDPDWFKDLSTAAKTKEEFMYKNCQSRIRGYLNRAEQQFKECGLLKKGEESMKSKNQPKISDAEEKMIVDILQQFRDTLREEKYHGDYFQRSAQLNKRICDETGLFLCEGKYIEEKCSYNGDNKQVHDINPYSSREARILFSTWNLDHIIERSRSIVPSIIEAVQLAAKKKKKVKVNTEYFYSLMFTRKNLRLVHIVCHDKQEHSQAKCDKQLYFR